GSPSLSISRFAIAATPYRTVKGCGDCLQEGCCGRFIGGFPMDLEKYTERSKGFVQSAQGLALRSGHQRLSPEHLLKVLLEDKEGLCANLIRAAGGDPQPVLLAVDGELGRQPRVEGSGAGQVYLSPELARVFDQAET